MMPTPDQILEGLHAIANRWTLLAIAWHLYVAVLLLALWLLPRPTRRFTAVLLTLPLFSVSALAWREANPFNGSLFLVGALTLCVCARRLPADRVCLGTPWARLAGLLVVGYGWSYPHFLATASPLTYLYAAPTGLLPCPTLAIVIGGSLLLDGLGSRLWSGVLIGLGLFYGLFGVLYLDVALDGGLLVGAMLLIAQEIGRGTAQRGRVR